MATRLSMGALLVSATVVVVVAYLASERTLQQLAQSVVLYVVGVVWPTWWAVWLHRELRPTDARTRALAWSPVVVGCTTILAGMATLIVVQ
jgi:cytochrome c biogenesis protein CcdA